jgi:hypothetical protein
VNRNESETGIRTLERLPSRPAVVIWSLCTPLSQSGSHLTRFDLLSGSRPSSAEVVPRQELERRLRGRATESEESVRERACAQACRMRGRAGVFARSSARTLMTRRDCACA